MLAVRYDLPDALFLNNQDDTSTFQDAGHLYLSILHFCRVGVMDNVMRIAHTKTVHLDWGKNLSDYVQSDLGERKHSIKLPSEQTL